MKLKEFPLVSCLCVTKNKLKLLKRAIDCFNAQTYPNKELVIIKEEDDKEIRKYLKTLKGNNIRFIHVGWGKPKYKLGDLRNLSIKHANGEYICQWDDDDWHHAERLTLQVQAAIENCHPVSGLMNFIIYDVSSGKAWLTEFQLWKNTLVCNRKTVNECGKYPSLSKHEDTFFLNMLQFKSRIFPVVAPQLFVYCINHGNNTCSKDHFKTMLTYAQELPDESSRLIHNIMNNKYSVKKASVLLSSGAFLKKLNHYEIVRKRIEDQSDDFYIQIGKMEFLDKIMCALVKKNARNKKTKPGALSR